jgi:hypothetical protein
MRPAGEASLALRAPVVREAGELLLVALAFLLYFIVRQAVIAGLAIARADVVDRARLGCSGSSRGSGGSRTPSSGSSFNFVYFWLDFL